MCCPPCTHRTQRAVGAPVESADARSVKLVPGDGEIVHAEVVHVDGYLADGLRGVRVEQHLEIAVLSALRIGNSKDKRDGIALTDTTPSNIITSWSGCPKRSRVIVTCTFSKGSNGKWSPIWIIDNS